MNTININLFLETLASTGGVSLHFEEINGIVVHILVRKQKTIFLPIIEDEDMLGEEAALILEQLQILHLLPALVPDHPAAEFAKSLPPPSDL